MPGISAVIITYNEEKYIGQCLASLKGVADEIIVVDSYSTDKTREICENTGAKVIFHPFEGYIEQKNWAMLQAHYDHILSIDGDEMLSEELRSSILQVKTKWDKDGYYFNRLNNFFGKWMHHSGVYPDRKLRLVDRQKAYWDGLNPHDNLKLQKGTNKGFLKGDLLHFAHDTPEEYKEKIMKFVFIGAWELYRIRGKSSWFRILLSPTWRFVWNYVFRLGFIEGKIGLQVCYFNALYSYLKHLYTRKPEAYSTPPL